MLDVSAVTFMDSTGLAIIAGTLKRITPSGGRLCVRGASPMICRLLEITGIADSEYVEIFDPDNDLPFAANS